MKDIEIKSIPALKVHQWVAAWDEIRFDEKARQLKPQPYFYLCSIRASHLKALTGVYRRSIKDGLARAKDPNVQRGHEEARSEVIRDFVQYGFPWCEMRDAQRKSPDAITLRKPGWLPTAIIVNILPAGSKRHGVAIPKDDIVRVEERSGAISLHLPRGFNGADWEPQSIYPLEVIDGQHRLWAFEEFDPGDDFELPVVAFHGLDTSWQAYLFWSVNITPKRINRSLAFDLYPLLRREDWLDRFSGHAIYRETRCQELVESLWAHNDSPWYQRINMLGETKAQRDNFVPMVTQAAWIRSLMASFVKRWEGPGTIGGLFGASKSSNDPILPWNRAMQSGFLIYASSALRQKVADGSAKWAKQLRSIGSPNLSDADDPAFYGEYSLISTDQGIRGFLFIINDLCISNADELHLDSWSWEDVYRSSKAGSASATEEEAVTAAIKSLKKTEIARFLDAIATSLASYDWRTSSTPGLSDEERLRQSVFRGGSGYKELRRQLLSHLVESKGAVGKAASVITKALGY